MYYNLHIYVNGEESNYKIEGEEFSGSFNFWIPPPCEEW